MLGFLKNLFSSKGDEVLKNIIKEGAFLVDVRTPGEFASGSVKGAVNIPVNQVQSQISKFKGKKNIVVFCKSGGRSMQAKSILKRNGIQNVYNGGTWGAVKNMLNS